MIKNEPELLEFLCAQDRDRAARNVFKYTDCGAWIEFRNNGIILGSIVEGSDNDTESYELTYPFTDEDYGKRIEAIEKQAEAIWNWANVERENGHTDEEDGCDFPDVAYEYEHLK